MKQILIVFQMERSLQLERLPKKSDCLKSVRNRLNELSDFLLENKLGEIQRKPRVGIWLEANENQKEEIQKILSDENLQVGNYDPRDRVNETLKVFFNLRPWQTMTTQKLAEKLFLSVPTMLKVLKECEEWLEVYHISLVNERGKGYRLKSEEKIQGCIKESDDEETREKRSKRI